MSSFPVQSSGNLADKSLALGSSTTISDIDLTASFHEELQNLRSKLEQRDKDFSALQELCFKVMQSQQRILQAYHELESFRLEHATFQKEWFQMSRKHRFPIPRGNGLDIKCCERHSKHSSKKWSTTSDGSEWHQDPWHWNWWYNAEYNHNSQVVDNGIECREADSVNDLPWDRDDWDKEDWDRWAKLAQRLRHSQALLQVKAVADGAEESPAPCVSARLQVSGRKLYSL